MSVDRRSALKIIATGGAAAAATAAMPSVASAKKEAPPGAMGMLYDTTLCIGCKTCVVACKEANHLPQSVGHIPDAQLYNAPLDLDATTKNVIKLYKDGQRESYMKSQCMQCIDPGCASACMLHSLHKNETTGIVEYDPQYCVGCRYCQMACNFGVPKYEFNKLSAKIVKCEYCRHRQKDAATQTAAGLTHYPAGQGPACCEVCPREAVIYGTRDELIAIARQRVADNPGRYVEDRVYGIEDAGGTQVVYLAHVPFASLGLPDVGPESTPNLANTVQQGIYRGFIAPAVLYGALAVVMFRNRSSRDKDAEGRGEAGR